MRINNKKIIIIILTILCGFMAKSGCAYSVSHGAKYIFNNGQTRHLSVSALSSNEIVIAYQDTGESSYGKAIIGHVSDQSISYGAEYVFNQSATDYIATAALSENKFVIAYRDSGNLNYGTAILATVSGNTISFGTEFIFNPSATENISITELSENKFIIIYQDKGNYEYGTAIIGQISGDNISYSSEYVFNPTKTASASVDKLDASKIAIAFRNYDGQGVSIIGQLNNEALDFGQKYFFNTANTESVEINRLTKDSFVIAFRDVGLNGYGNATVGHVSGNTISFDQEQTFNTSNTNYVAVGVLAPSRFVGAFRDSVSGYGTIVIGDITDGMTNFSSEDIFNTSLTATTTIAVLSTNSYLIGYSDNANPGYGTAIVGKIPSVCGNGIIEEIEECDDGNINDGDNCSAICTVESVCGNNKLENGEECDDGNNQDEDGCSAICKIESEPEPNADADENSILDGDLIRNPNADGLAKFDVYIVKITGSKKFKRLILSPHVFESYGHLSWSNIKDVDQVVIDQFTTSILVRAYDPSESLNDPKVYQLTASGDNGTKNWLNITSEQFELEGYDWDAIYYINRIDRDAYSTGQAITI